MTSRRFPLRFDRWFAVLSLAVLLPPASAYIEVRDREVRVKMGWAFRSCFPRSAVTQTQESRARPLSRGVHGFAGRWLVNGSGRGILVIHLAPAQRAYVMAFPVRLRQLMVSVEDPRALAAALTGSF